MTELELTLPTGVNFGLVEQVVEECCAAAGLIKTLKDTLKKYPGCLHWHYKQPGQNGTLEITLWPAGRRLWFKVQSRRRALWIEEVTPILQARVEQDLRRVIIE
jgi:hypothetical protein